MVAPEDGPIIVVASTLEKAEEMAGGLSPLGLSANATTDIGWALDESPSVLVVEPTGWEATARSMLSGFDLREAPPPAIVLVGSDPTLPYSIGMAFRFCPLPLDIHQLHAAVKTAHAHRSEFARHWPRMLNLKRVEDFKCIEAHLTKHTGMTLRDDWRLTFQHALQERMVANLTPTIGDYEHILARPGGVREIHFLACRLVVGETHFWRYSGQMNCLKTILARQKAKAKGRRSLRIWSAASSTGEEAYSILMAALEALGSDADVEVVGTDINPVALATARHGVYSDRSVRNLPGRLLARFFNSHGRHHTLRDEIKNRARFEELNLCSEEAVNWVQKNGPFDAVFCRNVTIYFTHQNSRRVVELCASSLIEGGGMFLGSSETVHPPIPGINIMQAPGAFYYVKSEDAEPARHDPAVEPTKPKAEPQKAEPGRQSIIETEPVFRRGLEALGREDLVGAENAFSDLVAKDPSCPFGNTGLALLLANQGREVEARGKLMRVVGRGHEPAEAHFILGILDERAQSPQEALKHYEHTLKLNPDFFMAHINSAWIHKRANRNSQFVEEMKAALAILKRSAKIPPWVTGGLGMEAIYSLVAEAALGGEGQT